MKNFAGKVAVVTGAGSGIGQALAISLAGQGCHLALADINEDSLKETQKILDSNAFEGNVHITLHTVDVSQWDQVQAFSMSVAEQHGQVDILINNAGVAMGALLKDASLEDMRWIMDINFWGVVYGCKAFAPLMKRLDEASIVNVSSVFGLITAPMQSAYCASKFAVRGFSDSLRQEAGYMGKNLKVACAFPAGIKTNIADSARLTLHPKSDSSPEQERDRMEKWFWTSAEDAASDILKGIRKGKTRIKVGKGSTIIDLASRLLPVKYNVFL